MKKIMLIDHADLINPEHLIFLRTQASQSKFEKHKTYAKHLVALAETNPLVGNVVVYNPQSEELLTACQRILEVMEVKFSIVNI